MEARVYLILLTTLRASFWREKRDTPHLMLPYTQPKARNAGTVAMIYRYNEVTMVDHAMALVNTFVCRLVVEYFTNNAYLHSKVVLFQ